MNSEQLLEVIGGCAREVLPHLSEHQFSPSDQLSELGANSMDRAEIVMRVMEELSLQIPRTELFGPRNVGELVDLISQKMHS